MSKYLAGKKEEFERLKSRHLDLLNDIFKTLNSMDFEVKDAVEYFLAMVLFTGDLKHFIKHEPSIEKWDAIYSKDQRDEVAEWFAKALYNSAHDYGEEGKLEEMRKCISRIEELYREKPIILEPFERAVVLISMTALYTDDLDLIIKAYRLANACPTSKCTKVLEKLKVAIARMTEKNPDIVDELSKLKDAALLNEIYDIVQNERAREKIIEALKRLS